MTATTTFGLQSCELRPTMPLLEEMNHLLGGLAPTARGLIGVQHLFGSTASLVHRLCSGRIDSDDVFLAGKPYSTNPHVRDYLRGGLGYWVHPDSADQRTEDPNDPVMDGRISDLLDRVQRRFWKHPLAPDQRIVLIDDGGRAISMAHDRRYADIRRHLVCVEQTRCGIRHLEGMDLEVPVVNVAESETKLVYESPLIAESMVAELTAKLDGLATANVPIPGHALIIGYGAIGQAVAAEIERSGRNVAVFDKDRTRLRTASRDGFATTTELGSALRRGGVIVGCTGLPTLLSDDYHAIAPGSILISASSADIEFTAWNLRRQGECLGNPSLWAGRGARSEANQRRWDHPCFSLYRCGDPLEPFYLVNGGFPVNFDGGVDTIAPHKIQLTRALLCIGAIQASHATGPGVIALDHGAQEQLIRLWSGVETEIAA